MRLQMRYESAEMGMNDERWALNIMPKLAKHKPKKTKKGFQGFGNTHRATISVISIEYFWQKLPPVLLLIIFLLLSFECTTCSIRECTRFNLRRKMINRNDRTVPFTMRNSMVFDGFYKYFIFCGILQFDLKFLIIFLFPFEWKHFITIDVIPWLRAIVAL